MSKRKVEQALVCTNLDDQSSDYKLVGNSCWISVGKFSVYVVDLGTGVEVGIWPLNCEMAEALGSCEAWESDLPESEDEDE